MLDVKKKEHAKEFGTGFTKPKEYGIRMQTVYPLTLDITDTIYSVSYSDLVVKV